MTDQLPDPEGGCRSWLRSLPGVTALVAQRVFFAVPDDADEDDFPLVTVARAGGGDDSSEAPVDLPLLQLTVIGQRRDKTGAQAVERAIREAVKALRGPVAWGSDSCLAATTVSSVFIVDPGDSRPRYNVTVSAAVVRT